MLFVERENKAGFTYTIEDVFGKATIKSSVQLEGDILDGIVSVFLNNKSSAGHVEGTVKLGPDEKDPVVSYVFDKAKMWSEYEHKYNLKVRWKNSRTKTRKQAKGSLRATAVRILIKTRIGNWLVKFAGAFREAWKRT